MHGPAQSWKNAARWMGIIGGLLLLAVVADVGTSSPVLCASCHEMRERAHQWATSAHGAIKCVQCHQEPTRWYELPKRLAHRSALFSRDIQAHVRGGYEDPVGNRGDRRDSVTDEACLSCHAMTRKVTAGDRILIDHEEHARRNGSCSSCHLRTAHPIESRGSAISLMAQCFTCHGVEPDAAAPGDCALCHPKTYGLRPDSHAIKAWERTVHSKTALSDPQQCTLCHTRAFCTDCHGLQMPHPKEWVDGDRGHAAAVRKDRTVCDKCHSSSPSICTMCHHESFMPTRGTWRQQHFIEVKQHGAARCFECHLPVFCASCHARS